MNKKKGLGRGLEALLGASEQAGPSADGMMQLAVTQLKAGKYQPRKTMADEGLDELANSIREQGIMQPLLVRELNAGQYEIIAGERRFRAAQKAGLKKVPVLIKKVDDKTAAAMALIENMQREDLNPIEESLGLSRLIEEFSYTHEQAAQVVGKSRSAVSNLLRLSQLPKGVQQMLAKGELDMGHARALLALPANLQLLHAQKVLAQGLSVRETEKMVTQATLKNNAKPSKLKSKQSDPDILSLQEKLSDQFNLNVQIKTKGRGGEISIKFTQFDELDPLFKKLGLA
jgi:ParB family chromosome partitioning protein